MKNSLFTALFLAALFLVPNAALASLDYSTQIEKTVVQVQAHGSDTEWISSSDNDAAKALAAFASTYNKIVAKNNLTPEQLRTELTAAANEAINQQSASFRNMYDVEFSSVIGSNIPELKMNIYPQTNYGYRFEVTFTPKA